MQVYTMESVPVTVDVVVMDAGAGQMSNWFVVEMSWRTGKRPLRGRRFRIYPEWLRTLRVHYIEG